jgi:hypothetical protein
LAIICPLPPPYKPTMRRAAFNEVDPHRPRCVRAKLLQLQTLLADLQGELAVGHFTRQTEALGPLLRLRFKRRAEGFDMDAAGRGLLNHGKHAQKFKDRQKPPITHSTRILPELSVNRKKCQAFFPHRLATSRPMATLAVTTLKH